MDRYNTTEFDKQKFNNFNKISKVPYFIITELLWDEEDIWKIIYYTSDEDGNPVNNPLDYNNLTSEQKINLIYKGNGDPNDYNIFFTTFPMQYEFTKQTQQLRIYRGITSPNDAYISNVSWVFELPCHENINTILVEQNQILVNRTDLLCEKIMFKLNGIDIGGIGKLQFNNDSRNNFNDRCNYANFGKQFNGLAFTMSCNWTGTD